MLGYAYLADYVFCTSLPYILSLLHLPCLPSLLRLLCLLQRLSLLYRPAAREGEAFRGRVPLSIHCLCIPSDKCALSDDCSPKESNSPSAACWHFEAVPPKSLLVLPKSEQSFFFLGQKKQVKSSERHVVT